MPSSYSIAIAEWSGEITGRLFLDNPAASMESSIVYTLYKSELGTKVYLI